MANIDKISGFSTQDLIKQKEHTSNQSGADFAKTLQNAIEDVNSYQEKADKAMADLATGEVKDLHQAAIAIGKAEMSMKLMLEIRNKALSAYKELSRTQM